MQLVVDSILTNYQKLGDAKKTIIILHGWGRSLREWLPIANELAKNYTVLLVDLPGFGQTPRPQQTYKITDYALFVQHFLEKLEKKRTILIGHSFGGRIGIILGAKTTLLDKLILVDCAAIEKKSALLKLKITINKLVALPFKLLFPRKAERLKTKFGSNDYQTAGNMRDIFIQTVNEDLSPYLAHIKTPTLLIWGENDTVRPLSEAKYITKYVPNAVLRIIWGAGHSPFLEKKQAFMETLEEYL